MERKVLTLKKLDMYFDEKNRPKEDFKEALKSLVFQEPKKEDPPEKPQKKKTLYETYKLHLKIVKWLEETYPVLFDRKNPKPLKKGVTKEILAQGPFPYANKHIRPAIRLYTHFTSYHKSVLSNTHRYDLHGEPSELITEKEKAYSQTILEQRKLRKNNYNSI